MSKGRPISPKEQRLLEEFKNPEVGNVVRQSSLVTPPHTPPLVPVVERTASAKTLKNGGRYVGTIVKIVGWYGFIGQDDLPGREHNAYFLLRGAGTLKKGYRVSYTRSLGKNGYVAVDLRRIL